MPEDLDYDNDDLDDDTNDGDGLVGKLRKQVRDANKRAKAAEELATTNATAARRVAFLDAEIPDTPQTKFFREKYDGPFEKDAIRQAAIDNGFLTVQDHSADLDAMDLASGAMSGGELPERPGSMNEYQEALRTAAENAPRGQESQAIAAVHAKYARVAVE